MIIDPKDFSFTAPGRFIVIDGVNGAGKTTLGERLRGDLTERGLTCITTREPGATQLGRNIREIVLTADYSVSSVSELLLFAADRAQHVAQVIEPALNEDTVVISDRYTYSSLAFQGYGRGMNLETIRTLNEIATGGLAPDLVILLDLDPLVGLQRADARNDTSSDNFEKEALDFHTRLREGFLEIARESNEPFLIIDAAQSAELVFAEARAVVQQLVSATAGGGAS